MGDDALGVQIRGQPAAALGLVQATILATAYLESIPGQGAVTPVGVTLSCLEA
ncbi:MAG: hypothetical protein U0931_29830 [Vulcanimicrobiota bacterium]